MATGHVLPSLLQAHGGLDPLFVNHEKLSIDQESEITSWLKLDESLPPLVSSITSSFLPSSTVPCNSSVDSSEFIEMPSSSILSQTVPSAGFPNVKSFSQLPPVNKHISHSIATSNNSVVHSNSSSTSSNYNGLNSSSLYNSTSMNSVQPSSTGQYQTHPFPSNYTTNQYSFPTFPGPTFTSFANFNSFVPQHFSYASNIVTATAVNPSSPLHSSSSSTSSIPNSPTGSPHPYSSPVHPSQLSSFSYPIIPELPQVGPPQFMQLFAQFHQYVKQHHQEEEDKKKRDTTKLPVRRIRQPRPKVVEAKGAVQCQGKNRKKGTQCRNAALMEYIGPRPIYCAEHIELDPRSLYEKCKSLYQKDPGDNKGCKEVVLKEFGMCYKHFPDFCNQLIQARDAPRARKHYERVVILLAQLEKEAATAKKKDGDLYQRKNKLIPKFQEMKRIMAKTVEALEGPGSLDSHSLSTSHGQKESQETGILMVSSSSGSESDASSPLNGFHNEESESEHTHTGWFLNDPNQDLSPKMLELSDEDIVDAFADFSDE